MEVVKCSKSELAKPGGAEVGWTEKLLKYNFACCMRSSLPSRISLLCTVFPFPIILWVAGCSTTTPNCHCFGRPHHPDPPAILPNPTYHHSYLWPPLRSPAHYWCFWQPTWPKFLNRYDKYQCDQDLCPSCRGFHPFLYRMVSYAPVDPGS